MDHSLNSLNNFDFLARSFARMHAEGRPVDILAVTGNMDEEHRTWFCARYAWYWNTDITGRLARFCVALFCFINRRDSRRRLKICYRIIARLQFTDALLQ